MACLAICCLPPSQSHLALKQERELSRRLVAGAFPELVDLVDDGSLLVLKHYRNESSREPLLLFLLGTSHFSTGSATHVHRVVTAVRPQNVVVELCRSRAGLLYEIPDHNVKSSPALNLLSMTDKSFTSAVGRSMGIGGQSAMTLRLLLALVSDKLTAVTGVASGEEFRAAYKVAIAVNAQIVLGDRPIEITLKHAWEALDWASKLRLTLFLLRGIRSLKLDLSEESLQSLRSDDTLSLMFGLLSKEFPALLPPLIHDRDRYLAWSLTQSKAVNGSLRVVGIVGQGHLKGIVHALKYEKEKLRFRDLAGIRRSFAKQDAGEQTKLLLARLVVETILGFLLWLAFNHWCRDGETATLTNLLKSSFM